MLDARELGVDPEAFAAHAQRRTADARPAALLVHRPVHRPHGRPDVLGPAQFELRRAPVQLAQRAKAAWARLITLRCHGNTFRLTTGCHGRAQRSEGAGTGIDTEG